MRKLSIVITFLMLITNLYSQSITSPSSVTLMPNTPNQSVGGFSVSGFNTNDILLLSIGLINPNGTTLGFSMTSGVTPSIGYNLNSNFQRISFTGKQSDINNTLSTLFTNTGSSGNIDITVSVTINPSGYFYLPSNGHFYRPMNWPPGYSGSTSVYTNLLNLSSSQTFKGQTGYLVTITSIDEQNFIQSNVPGNNILIALSDRQQEGVWRWDAGPELGDIIKTSNSGGEVSGKYNNWCNGEPNNWGSGEDYVVTKWNGGNCWNDFGPPASNFPGSISGYVVEFGTWDDPSNQSFSNFYNSTTSISISQPQPFEYTGYIYNSSNIGVMNIPIKLYTSPSGQNNFSIYNTYYTNLSGFFSIQTAPLVNRDFKIVIDSPTIPNINMSDISHLIDIIIYQNKSPVDYYKWDANENDSINITDAYILSKLIQNIDLTDVRYRYFTQSEWSQILSLNNNQVPNIEGHQTINLDNPPNNGNSTHYIIFLGKI